MVDDNNPETEERRLTEKAMERYSGNEKVCYLKHPENKNGAAARNTGIREAEGEYITFLDDDDYIFPGRVSLAVRALEESGCRIAFFDVAKETGNGRYALCGEPKEISPAALLKNAGMLGTGSNVFVHRSVVEKTGGFNEQYVRYQDVEFMGRALYHFRPVWIHRAEIKKLDNGTFNRPNIRRLSEMQDLLHGDMRRFMGITDPDLCRQIEEAHAGSLLMKSLSGKCSREEVAFARGRLEAYRPLNRKEQALYLLHRCSPALYRFIRSRKHIRTYSEQEIQERSK